MEKVEKYYVGHSYSQCQSQLLYTLDQILYFLNGHLRSYSLRNILSDDRMGL
jgi:hypothetical protein